MGLDQKQVEVVDEEDPSGGTAVYESQTSSLGPALDSSVVGGDWAWDDDLITFVQQWTEEWLKVLLLNLKFNQKTVM